MARNKSIVVLSSQGSPRPVLTKKFIKTETGIEKIGYDKAKEFSHRTFEFENIQEFLTLIEEHSRDKHRCFIRGSVKDDMPRVVTRTLDSFEDTPKYFFCVDIDDEPIPEGGFDPAINPRGAAIYLVQNCLPAEFQAITFVYQWSSSMGFTEKPVYKCHLWFFLDRPILTEDLRRWAYWWNESKKRRVIDPALYNAVQPHFIAAPILDGLGDPIQKRIGLSDYSDLSPETDKHKVVALVEPPTDWSKKWADHEAKAKKMTFADMAEAIAQETEYVQDKWIPNIFTKAAYEGIEEEAFVDILTVALTKYLKNTGNRVFGGKNVQYNEKYLRARYKRAVRDVDKAIAAGNLPPPKPTFEEIMLMINGPDSSEIDPADIFDAITRAKLEGKDDKVVFKALKVKLKYDGVKETRNAYNEHLAKRRTERIADELDEAIKIAGDWVFVAARNHYYNLITGVKWSKEVLNEWYQPLGAALFKTKKFTDIWDTDVAEKKRAVDYTIKADTEQRLVDIKGVTYLNLWTGLTVKPDPRGSPKFLELVKTVLPNEAERKLFLQIYAHTALKPWQKMRYATILIGEKGVGKSMLLNIMTDLFGEMAVQLNNSSAQEKYNDYARDNLVAVFHEICHEERGVSTNFMEDWKNMISEDKGSIRGFYQGNKQGEYRVTYWCATNHLVPFKVTSDDRKFLLLTCSPKDAVRESGFDFGHMDIVERRQNLGGILWELTQIDFADLDINVPMLTAAFESLVEDSTPDWRKKWVEQMQRPRWERDFPFFLSCFAQNQVAEYFNKREMAVPDRTSGQFKREAEKVGGTRVLVRQPNGADHTYYLMCDKGKYKSFELSSGKKLDFNELQKIMTEEMHEWKKQEEIRAAQDEQTTDELVSKNVHVLDRGAS